MPRADLQTEVQDFLSDCAPKTREVYANALNRIFDAGKIDSLTKVKAFNYQQARTTLANLAATYAPATVGATFTVYKKLLRLLLAKGIIDRKPLEAIAALKMPAVDNVPWTNVLQDGEDGALERLIARGDAPLRDRAIYLALVMMGPRVSEMCGWTWGQFSKQRVTGKNKLEREAWVVEYAGKRKKIFRKIVPDAVMNAAQACRAGRKPKPTDPFIAWDGRAPNRFELYKLVKSWGKVLGHKLTPHGLRATYVTRVIDERGIEVARQLAGHASITTTTRYSRKRYEE